MLSEFLDQCVDRFALKRIPAVFEAIKGKSKRLLVGKASPILDMPASLSALRASLVSMSQRAEPKFLQIGEELQTVYSDASGLAQETVEAVGLIGSESGQGILTTINELANGSMEELETCKAQVSGSLDRVKAVIGNLDNLILLCGVAEKITMVLNVVGFNIDVESARSVKSREMFGVVAQEIREFSEKVIGIVRKIYEDTKSAHILQTSACEEISRGVGELWELAERAGTTVGAAVKEIEGLMDFVLESMEQAGRASREISRQVSGIVVGIQFQDSMRQRIDHIQEALEDVEVLCEKNGKGDNGNADMAGRLRTACSTLQIQKAQLWEVMSEADSVYQKCRQAFGAIVSEVGKLGSSLSNLESGEDFAAPTRKNPFSSLVTALDNLDGILEKGRGLVDRVQKGAAYASETGARLADYTEEVHKISLRTQLMALNAVVKAAHLGQDGTTLEVLAQEVRTLSVQSGDFVSDMSTVLERLSESAVDRSSQEQKEEGTSDEANLKITETYDEFRRRASDSLTKAGDIGTAISRIQGSLAFLPALSEEVNGCIEELEGIIQTLAPLAGTPDTSLMESKRIVEDRYTMQHERDIHERIMETGGDSSDETSGGEDGRRNEIELFTNEPSGAERNSVGGVELFAEDSGVAEEGVEDNVELFGEETESKEEDLGDNIELF